MRRRDKTGGEAIKTRRRKTVSRHNALKAASRRKPSAVDAYEKIALLEHRLNEALEQQAATAEVLNVVSNSPGVLKPVFQTILANAVRICEAKFGVLYPYENGIFHPAAEFGVPPTLSEFIQQRGTFQPRPKTTLDRLMRTKEAIYCADVRHKSYGEVRWCTNLCSRSDAQGAQTNRHDHYLSQRSSTFHRQTG